MIPLNSEEITLCYDSVGGGSICLWYLYVFSMHWYFLIFSHWTVKRSLCAMTVLTGEVHLPLVAICFLYAVVFPDIFSLNSEEITLCYDSVDWGGPSAFGSYMFSLCTGISWYFLIEQWRDHSCYDSVDWGVHLPLVSICFLYALVFPDIFSLNSEAITLCCDSVRGGPSAFGLSMTPLNTEAITLCSDSGDWGGPSAFGLSMTPLNTEVITLCSDSGDWGSICLWYLYVFSMHWYFLIFSYYLTVLNGLSLATLQSVEFT